MTYQPPARRPSIVLLTGKMRRAFTAAAGQAPWVINALAHAEALIGFRQTEDVEQGLPSVLFRRRALPYEAGFREGSHTVRAA